MLSSLRFPFYYGFIALSTLEVYPRGERLFAGPWQDQALALARQIGGDRGAADAALQTLIEKDASIEPYQIAQVYALRNDATATFEWLDRALSNRDAGIVYLLYDPFILRYRNDPRFAAFCRKAGLPVRQEVSS